MSKYDRQPLKIQIQETPTPTYPFQIIHLDIYQIERQLFLSCVDKFSKFARMTPVESHQTIHVEKAFWDSITSFVVPEIVVIDNEACFQTASIRGRMLDLGIQVYITPPHRSEVNGPVERLHSTITEIYRIQKNLHPDWTCTDLIATSVEKYNNTIHSSIKRTPKEVVFGINATSQDPEQLELIRRSLYDEVLVKLKETQARQLQRNQDRSTPPALKPNQVVYVKDKLIKPKHKNRFKRTKVQADAKVTFTDSEDHKAHKTNVKNVNLKQPSPTPP